jgi:hypothetical protein
MVWFICIIGQSMLVRGTLYQLPYYEGRKQTVEVGKVCEASWICVLYKAQ